MNINSLYPVVMDLSDAEYSSHGFCTQYLCSGGVEFSFTDLLSPANMPMPSQEDHQNEQRTNASRRPLATTPLSQDSRNEYEEAAKDRRMTFHDCYVLTRQIHKGMVSVIWECIHRATGQRFAVKIIDRRLLNQRGEAAAYREVHMLDILDPSTPGTIHLHHFFDEPTHLYIVTEYVPGGNLLSRIVRKKQISEDDTKSIVRCILQCLSHLHGHGTVHRNVKPDNIVLEGISAFIIDYGLAARLMYDDTGEMVLLTSRCAPSQYVAPEMLNRQPYACQVDMWGVGILAYMCLAGYPPFADDSKQILFSKISKAAYTFDPQDWEGVSRLAKRFISALLHADPAVRLTADEALAHAWLAEPIPDPPQVEVTHSPPVAAISRRKTPTTKLRRALSNLLGKKDAGTEKSGDDASTTSYNTSNLSSSDAVGTRYRS